MDTTTYIAQSQARRTGDKYPTAPAGVCDRMIADARKVGIILGDVAVEGEDPTSITTARLATNARGDTLGTMSPLEADRTGAIIREARYHAEDWAHNYHRIALRSALRTADEQRPLLPWEVEGAS